MSLSPSGDAGAESQLKLEESPVRENWSRFVESYRLAATFVRDNFGVKKSAFMPYEAMLPVLASYYFRNDNKAISSVKLKDFVSEWFWRVSFSERYSAAAETHMTEDRHLLGRLIDEGETPNLSHIRVTLDEKALITASMTTQSALRNGLLCLLAQKGPLHFINGGEISVSDDYYSEYMATEKHHIFPQAFLKQRGLQKRLHSLANFCFIPAELNQALSDTKPSVYFSRIRKDNYDFEKIMRSHLIPVDEDSGIWTDDYDKFLFQRAPLLLEEIYRLCCAELVIQPEERQPLIKLLEEEIRDHIDLILKQQSEDYWKYFIPNDIDAHVKTRIEHEIETHPGKKLSDFSSPRRKLTFCNVMDYCKIISQKNVWRHFEATFRPEKDVEGYFRAFSDYRNAVVHGRDIDALLEARSKAAIIWFSNILDIPLSDVVGD